MAIDTIKSTAVLDGAIATADIANDAVTTAKLGSITDIASSSGAMTLSPAGTEILNVGTTGDILVKGQGNNRAALVLRAGSNTANSQLQLGDQSSDFVGRIMYDHSDDTMRFQTNGSERVRISASGIHIGGTGAANALDDYEEGTFTPTPVVTYNPGGVSISNITQQVGVYVKVGSMVFFHLRVRFDKSGSGGNIGVDGMPFAANNLVPYGNIGMAREGATEGSSYQLEGISNGTTQIGVMRKYDNTGFGTGTKDVQGFGFYRTDS